MFRFKSAALAKYSRRQSYLSKSVRIFVISLKLSLHKNVFFYANLKIKKLRLVRLISTLPIKFEYSFTQKTIFILYRILLLSGSTTLNSN